MPLANVNSPRGFSLYRSGGHREPNRVERPVVANRTVNTLIMIGDAYGIDANGNAFRALGNEAEAASVVRGIVEGFRFESIDASPQGPVSKDYIPVDGTGFIIGIEDADAEFCVLVDATGATQANVGNDCDLTNIIDGYVPLHQSRQQIDGATFGLGGTGQFIMTELKDSPADNSPGAYAQIIVKILNKVI